MVAQSLKTEDGIMHWEAEFDVGLNTDGYQLDIGVAYFPIRFLGIKARLGMAGEIEELGDWGKDEYETGHRYAARVKFSPSFVLRSPRLLHWKSQDAGFYLFVEPGMILSPGAVGSRHAKWSNWNLLTGINMQMDCFIVRIGYGVTEFTLYSGYPDSHWGAPDKDAYLTHSFFIGGAYKF